MTTKRQVRRADNARPLWATRQALARRSPVDDASVAFDLARKQVKAVRDQSEQDRRWRDLARILREFTGGSGGDAA